VDVAAPVVGHQRPGALEQLKTKMLTLLVAFVMVVAAAAAAAADDKRVDVVEEDYNCETMNRRRARLGVRLAAVDSEEH
jgi:hypothetical protein